MAKIEKSAEPSATPPGPVQRGLSGLLGAWEDPASAMRRMSEQMDRIFDSLMGARARGRAQGEVPGAWSPQVEVSQRGDELVVGVDLPGIRREDVQVEIDDGRLVVRGERRASSERPEAGVLRSECSYGEFYRAIPLPEGAKSETARAAMRDGVLEVTMTLPPRKQPRRLEIEDADAPERREAHRYPTAEPRESEQDRRGERRDWQGEGRLGM